jgi:hypothetical protein
MRAWATVPALFTPMRIVLLFIWLLSGIQVLAQMAEVYGGNKRSGVDIMWFKYFRNQQKENSAFLFFSRNRASIDYKQSPTVFGSTNAVSYNFKSGIGMVAVGSFINSGFVPKAGVQYFKAKHDFVFFGWLVADLKKKGNVDLFGLFKYTPKISEQWRLFSQVELFPVYNPSSEIWNLTQRFRLGGKCQAWAGGLMLDLNQTGKANFTSTNNIGGFIRYDF